MIRTKTAFVLGLSVFFASSSAALPPTQVRYKVKDLGSGRWRYTYDVTNHSLSAGIEEFTIWFDYGLYDNLTIDTADPPAGDWDEIVWQPDPVVGSDGGYDGLVNVSSLAIKPGQTVNNFSVSFDWLGVDEPGSQYYEIADPNTFEAIDSGYTTLATLKLLDPNGGEELRAGSTYAIEWIDNGVTTDIVIEYSTNNAFSWKPVSPPNEGNTGSYDWMVPWVDSLECVVRVSDAGDPNVFDVSEIPFRILILFECDFNGDHKVNFKDIVLLVGDWLENGSPADVFPPRPQNDNIVDFFDFAICAREWMTEIGL